MIKATGQKDGRPLMLLGLSAGNIERLMDGQPILFDAKAQGYDGHILIVYGATEKQIARDLELHFPGVKKHTGEPT